MVRLETSRSWAVRWAGMAVLAGVLAIPGSASATTLTPVATNLAGMALAYSVAPSLGGERLLIRGNASLDDSDPGLWSVRVSDGATARITTSRRSPGLTTQSPDGQRGGLGGGVAREQNGVAPDWPRRRGDRRTDRLSAPSLPQPGDRGAQHQSVWADLGARRVREHRRGGHGCRSPHGRAGSPTA